MWPVMAYLSIGAVRADAVFASGLQRCDELSAGQVRQAVAAAIRALGCSGCAGQVAQEFGDHPETAVIRMRWARAVAREAFADSAPEPGLGADAGGLLVVRPRLPAEQASGSPGARVGDGEGAALEMERHLWGLLYMWRLGLPSSQAPASEAVT